MLRDRGRGSRRDCVPLTSRSIAKLDRSRSGRPKTKYALQGLQESSARNGGAERPIRFADAHAALEAWQERATRPTNRATCWKTTQRLHRQMRAQPGSATIPWRHRRCRCWSYSAVEGHSCPEPTFGSNPIGSDKRRQSSRHNSNNPLAKA